MALIGNVDTQERDRVAGWARDDTDPNDPVGLAIEIDGRIVVRVLANIYREDLEKAFGGNGRHAFEAQFPPLSPLEPHSIRVLSESDGTEVKGSRKVIPASRVLDTQLQTYLAWLLPDTDQEAELARRAAFLAGQVDRLLQRRADLAGHHGGADRIFRARWTGRTRTAPDTPLRALVIDASLPAAKHDAGSNAILSHMRSLQRLGFGVSFVPADLRAGPAAEILEAMGVTCCCLPFTASVEEVLRRQPGFTLVYLHRVTTAFYLPMLRHYMPRARLVFSVADLHSLRVARQGTLEDRPELVVQARTLRGRELLAARQADCVVTHSSHEAALLRQDLPGVQVHVVPWAVPLRPVEAPFEQRRGIAFIGAFSHAPNVDAAWWLIHEIMPLLRTRDPSIECLLIGSDLPEALQQVAQPGIVAVGQVDDLAPVLARLRLTVAPLAYGAGIKGKVLDSLAHGIPCACTPIAAEGLDLPDALQPTIGDGAAALAEAIWRLHTEQDLNAACTAAGLAYIKDRMSERSIDGLMRAVAGPALR